MEEIEHVIDEAACPPLLQRRLQGGKIRYPVVVRHDNFAVDQRGRGGKTRDRCSGGTKPCGPVKAIAGLQRDFPAVEPRLYAVAVELNLVDKVRPVGRRRGKLGKRRGNEVWKRSGAGPASPAPALAPV